ncbi:WD repeat-containing protein 3 homolog [Cyclospora cayetanensis]|uniref:WD repeat-containing protein 3 homolog n=1 Tax=Cyclospora cayetanensis TaxID=88456 RepID=A0A6P6RSN7_9EIME|nr:WD repeat-containing protein 3 homolog [Cyclospora cayetanensis]
MVKAYLNYKHAASFGLTATPSANLVLLPGVGPSFSSCSGDLVWCCCGSEAVLWHTQQRQQLLRLQPPPVMLPDGELEVYRQAATVVAPAAVAAAVAVGYSDGSIRVWSLNTSAAATAALEGKQHLLLSTASPSLVLHGHRGSVSALQWAVSSSTTIRSLSSTSSTHISEDLLVSGGVDGDVIVWDALGGIGRCRLRGHTQPVTALLPLHATLALEAAAKEEADAEEDAIAATATAATAARDGETQQHAAPGKQRNNKRKAHSHVSQNSSDACNTTNSSVLLLSGSKDGLLKIWDVDLQLCLHTEVGAAEAGEVWTLAVNPCQTRLFVGGGDHKIRVFALHLGLHAAAASNASASEAAAAQITRAVTRYLGSVSPNRSSKKQRVRWLQFVATEEESLSPAAAAAAAGEGVSSPVRTGGLLLCCSGGSRIVDFYRCLNAEEQKRQQLKRERRAQQRLKKKQQQEEEEKGQQQHDQQQHDQQFSEMLYVGSLHASAVVKGFNARGIRTRASSNSSAADLRRTSSLCVRICMNLNNNTLEVWKADPLLLRKYRANGEDAFEHLTRFSSGGHAGQLRSLCTSHDDGYILSAADEGAKVWSASSSTVRCVKTLPCEEPQCGFVMAGNEHIVLGCRSGELLLFDLGSNELLQRTAAHAGAVNALAEHPKHTGFASASSDKTVKLFAFYISDELSEAHEKKKKKAGGGFSPKDQHQQISLRCEGSFNVPDEALDVAFHPVGNLLIVALIDHTILVLHADTGRIRLSLYGHKLPVTSVAVSSSGALLASGSVDKSLKIWGLDFGDIRKSFRAHEETVTKVAFLPLTHYVLTAGLDGFIKQWDADRHLLVKVYACGVSARGGCLGGAALSALCLSADGDFFCCSDSSRQLHLWRRTDEQVFAEEQQERRLLQQQQREAEGLEEAAATTAAAVTAVAPTVIMERPTKLTDEALKTADKLIEALQVARQQREEDAEFATAFFRWVSALPRDGCRSSFEADPLPMPPAARPELLGCSAHEHLLRCIYSIRAADAGEVLLALPLDYALELLQFLTELLETEAARLFKDSDAAQSKERRLQPLEHQCMLPGPTEVAVRLALQLVQLHFRLFIVCDKHRSLIQRLRAVIRPLLQYQRDALRFNSAALGVLLRCVSSSSSEALHQLRDQVSIHLPPTKKKRRGGPASGLTGL